MFPTASRRPVSRSCAASASTISGISDSELLAVSTLLPAATEMLSGAEDNPGDPLQV